MILAIIIGWLAALAAFVWFMTGPKRPVHIPGKYPWKGKPVDIKAERRAIQRTLDDLLREIDNLAEADAALKAEERARKKQPRHRPF